MPNSDRILALVQEAATAFGVFRARGPGNGNRVTNAAMRSLNDAVAADFGPGIVEPRLGPDAKQSVDFYLRDEATIIEVEFSLSNPYPCLEKDAFKALLAKSAGHPVRRLVLVGDPGCVRRLAAPASQAIMTWLWKQHDVEVQVVELKDEAPTISPAATG